MARLVRLFAGSGNNSIALIELGRYAGFWFARYDQSGRYGEPVCFYCGFLQHSLIYGYSIPIKIAFQVIRNVLLEAGVVVCIDALVVDLKARFVVPIIP